ncbi:MAG: DoxX family protein [Limisphaerales bacterium]
MPRSLALWLLAAFFTLAGMNHFLNPGAYLGLMPAYLPWHRELILVSGAAEVTGGLAVLIPRWRTCAGWGLIVLLVAVFPANLHVALHGWEGVQIPAWVLWTRLPVQGLFIAWVWWACIARDARR